MQLQPNERPVIPIQHSRIKGHMPCESCGVKRVKHKLQMPHGPTYRVCDNCVEGVRL